MYLSDIYTITGSLAGIPGISVPCGWVPAPGVGKPAAECPRLPVGMQLFTRHFEEARLLRLAYHFEVASGSA